MKKKGEELFSENFFYRYLLEVSIFDQEFVRRYCLFCVLCVYICIWIMRMVMAIGRETKSCFLTFNAASIGNEDGYLPTSLNMQMEPRGIWSLQRRARGIRYWILLGWWEVITRKRSVHDALVVHFNFGYRFPLSNGFFFGRRLCKIFLRDIVTLIFCNHILRTWDILSMLLKLFCILFCEGKRKY